MFHPVFWNEVDIGSLTPDVYVVEVFDGSNWLSAKIIKL